MQITIDNLAGAGPLDYTSSLEASSPLSIVRQLNRPTECTFKLASTGATMPEPVQYARIVVTSSGFIVFTGYVSSPPSMLLLGASIAGASYGIGVTALSDEVLLDNSALRAPLSTLGIPVEGLEKTLTDLTGNVLLSLPGISALSGNSLKLPAGLTWSEAVGTLASSVCAAYRVVNNAVAVSQFGSTSHQLNEELGTLQINALNVSAVKLLANDITVCGEVEASAYVNEFFQGDGVTSTFDLTHPPFSLTPSGRFSTSDAFDSGSLNAELWARQDPGSFLSITAAGLTCSGGQGQDGSTQLNLLQQVELGASIVIELGGVQIDAGGSGILAGLYVGQIGAANCVVGFGVSTSGGQVALKSVVEGQMSSPLLTLTSGHTYTFRVRMFSPEVERVRPSYYYINGAGTGAYGGDLVPSTGTVILEIQDVVSGAPGAVSVLYQGSLSLPPVATLGLINSASLSCSISTFEAEQVNAAWASLIPSGGSAIPQRIDTAVNGGACSLTSTGKLTFHSGSIPPANALIQLRYRVKTRAVARRALQVTSTSTSSATPSTQSWLGSVIKPAARSSVDCENAAAALLQSASAASAAWAGTYKGWDLTTQGDVWPGDLMVTTGVISPMSSPVVIRKVAMQLGTLTTYTIDFANAWAEELAISLSDSLPTDVVLPSSAIENTPLANLSALAVVSISGSAIQVNTGQSAPLGGGFEVRRTDWAFGAGTDSDLVLRSPVENFSIPRLAPTEQFYVRMYDAATPPNYSRFSVAVITNIPLS